MPVPTRDELTLAWGDTILGALPGIVRARFAGGRFLPEEAGRARFALPNEMHRARCEQNRSVVEDALAAHFGRPVPLTLVVEGASPSTGGGSAGGPLPAAPGPEPEPEADDFDVSELADAPADDRSDLQHLVEVFPGSELIEEENRP
ncbi:hypothetical protein BH18ACT4_BH18ACT4_08840 [soil metagenome]